MDSDEDPFADDVSFLDALESGERMEARLLECSGRLRGEWATANLQGIVSRGGLDVAFAGPERHRALLERTGDNLKVLPHGGLLNASSACIEHLDDLLAMARKRFMQIECDALRVGRHPPAADYLQHRKDVNLTFEYLTSFMTSVQSDENYRWLLEEQRVLVLEHLSLWRCLTKGLTHIDQAFLAASPDVSGNECRRPMYHLLHIHLELRWQQLVLLHACSNGEGLEDMLELQVTELVKLAETLWQEELDLGSPFHCACVRQLWLLLQVFADKAHSAQAISKSFWGVLRNVLEGPQSANRPVLFQGLRLPQKWRFVLWLYLHLVPLHGYDKFGIWQNELRDQESEDEDAEQLLEVALKQLLGEADERSMRSLLTALARLPEFCGLGAPALKLLLDYFVRNLSSPFKTSQQIASTVPKSAEQLVRLVKDLVRGNSPEQANSFEAFVQLLAGQVKHSSQRVRLFNQLQSSAFVKLVPGRVASFSDLGIFNLSTLCLALGQLENFEIMGGKLQNLLAAVTSPEERKRSAVMLAHTALISFQLERREEVTAAPILRLLDSYCRDLNEHSKALMTTFIESFEELAEKSSDTAIFALIGPWLPSYLGACNTHKAAAALNALVAAAQRFAPYPDTPRRFVAAFEAHVEPYLREQSLSRNPPASRALADVAVAFSKASDDAAFASLFQHFVLNDNIHPEVAAHYLSEVVRKDELLNRLRPRFDNFPAILIQAWARCCLFDLSSGSELSDITRLVCDLSSFKSIFGPEDLARLKNTSSPLELLGDLLGAKHSALKQDIRRSTELKSSVARWFEKLPVAANWAVGADAQVLASETHLRRMYTVIGRLISGCPAVLHTRANPKSTLGVLAKTLLLYEHVCKNPLRAIHPSLKSALENSLHLFLVGLGQLVEKDEYIRRLLVTVVEYFAHAVDETRQERHPIERAFGTDSPQLVDCLASVFGSKLLRPRGDSKHVICALRLLCGVVDEQGEVVVVVRALVRHTIKETVLLLLDAPEASFGALAQDYFATLVDSHAFRTQPEIRANFEKRLAELYQTKLAFQSKQLFRTLELLAALRPRLLKPTLPTLKQLVTDVETQRGRGADKTLRDMLDHLERKLWN